LTHLVVIINDPPIKILASTNSVEKWAPLDVWSIIPVVQILPRRAQPPHFYVVILRRRAAYEIYNQVRVRQLILFSIRLWFDYDQIARIVANRPNPVFDQFVCFSRAGVSAYTRR